MAWHGIAVAVTNKIGERAHSVGNVLSDGSSVRPMLVRVRSMRVQRLQCRSRSDDMHWLRKRAVNFSAVLAEDLWDL